MTPKTTERFPVQAPLIALEFLTVLRLRRPAIAEVGALGASQAFFPAVGLVLGAIAAGADSLLRDELGSGVDGWLVMGLLLVLTGALHADGLADTVDGLFGGHTPERRLEIMRDSSVGPFGVAALVFVLGLKAAAITALPGGDRTAVLILAPALARWASVCAIAAFPYARSQGLGAAFHARSLPWAAPLAGASALAAAAILMGLDGIAGWGLSLLGGTALGAFASSRLGGGLTGDTYGAVIEVVEAGLLVIAVARPF